MDIRYDLIRLSVSPEGPQILGTRIPKKKLPNFSWKCITTLLMEPVGPDGQTSSFLIHQFLVIRDFGSLLAKKIHELPLRPY
ncbi:hypothetical protein H5410_058913 [Solanum commersonii]|uniref:Uncharacterized protein n=1 Tax=Solanum commersonii TaxID=4109 RepID=A0A9J5W0Y4_SOLCO|nr:hypothetical protein H5410_058913 [Solanum commersonii]